MKEINDMKTNKATQSTDIPKNSLRKILIFLEFFPNSFKNAIITPVHKKGAKTSKIYERLIFKQISEYFELLFSKI